ncbi:HAD family hydrolase [Acidobacteriota bacterium]
MFGLENIRKDLKAIIFDLDGTLLNTLDDIADSMNCVLEENGFPIHAVEKYKYFVGDGITALVKRAIPVENRDGNTLRSLEIRMREIYKVRWNLKTRPYEGIPELLNGLKDRGVPMSILSNKPDEYTQLTVQKYLGEWPFKVVLGSKSDLPKKPAPHGVLAISQVLGVNPQECAYVGDMDIDMKTALAAGMNPIGVYWGFRTEEELIENGALFVFERPEDILYLFGKMEGE